jgi:hypothetical protein
MEYEFTNPVYFMYVLSTYRELSQLVERRAEGWAAVVQFRGRIKRVKFVCTPQCAVRFLGPPNVVFIGYRGFIPRG